MSADQFNVGLNMDPDVNERLSPEEQIEALASFTLDCVLAARGIRTSDVQRYVSVSRAQMVAYFAAQPRRAQAMLLKSGDTKPIHDVLCMESRDGKFVIYDMDHGEERNHCWYASLPEASADFVAFRFDYYYPDGYGFQKD
jgi:hypothetical protein